MRFRAPDPYDLVLTSRHPSDSFGRPVVASVDFDRHQIVLWNRLHGRARVEALRDQLELAWTHSVHQHDTKAASPDRRMHSRYFEEDLARQGGLWALEHMEPVAGSV